MCVINAKADGQTAHDGHRAGHGNDIPRQRSAGRKKALLRFSRPFGEVRADDAQDGHVGSHYRIVDPMCCHCHGIARLSKRKFVDAHGVGDRLQVVENIAVRHDHMMSRAMFQQRF